MTILEPRPKPAHYFRQTPSPNTSMVASLLLPGLGQLMSGERRKGVLFFLAHVINFALIAGLIFVRPLNEGLKILGQQNHMRLNQSLSQLLANLGPASPLAWIIAALFFSFALFAARDAFAQSSKIRRDHIYHDHVLEMPEAASGSYIFHGSFLLSCIILALFFLIPAPPPRQVVDIEFRANEENTREKQVSNKRALHSSKAAGKHDPTRPSDSSAASSSAKTNKADVSKIDRSKALTAAKPAASPAAPPITPSVPRPTRSPLPLPLSPFSAPPAPSLNHAVTPPLPQLPQSVTKTVAPLLPAPAVAVTASSSFAPAPHAVSLPATAATAPQPRSAQSGGSPSATAPGPVAVSVAGQGDTSSRSPLPVPIGSTGHGKSSSSNQGVSEAPAPSRSPRSGGPAIGLPGPAFGPKLASGNGNGRPNPDSGPAAGQSENVERDINWAPYMADLQRHIRRCWYPPRGPETKRVKVIFTVLNNGEMTNLRLLQSSGLNISDQAALKAVENAAPFRHLPDGAPASVDIEFTFDYNVFSGGAIR